MNPKNERFTTSEDFRESGLLVRRDHILGLIPIDELLSKYHVTNEQTIEAVHELPTLVYLLGRVSPEPQFNDSRPDGVTRPIWLLEEGSGMFGLKNPDDARRWKGINNHVYGTARQTFILSNFLSKLTPDQIESFSKREYDVSTLSKLNPYILRDFMLISHGGRRESDELNWHGELLDPQDSSHQESDSGHATVRLLKNAGAPEALIELMRVETHGYLINQIERHGKFRDFEDISLTVPDWMFGQGPNTLEDRFRGLRASKRASDDTLDKLGVGAFGFQKDFEEITGINLYSLMTREDPFDWEVMIREAYCAPSGIDPKETFPGFYSQYPQLG